MSRQRRKMTFTGIVLQLLFIAWMGVACGYAYSISETSVAVAGDGTVHALVEVGKEGEGGPMGYSQFYLTMTPDKKETILPGVFGRAFFAEDVGLLVQLQKFPSDDLPGMVVYKDGKLEIIEYAEGLTANEDEARQYEWVLGNGQAWLAGDAGIRVMGSLIPGQPGQEDTWIVELVAGKLTGRKVLEPSEPSYKSLNFANVDYRAKGGPVALFSDSEKGYLARQLVCDDTMCRWGESSLAHLIPGNYPINSSVRFFMTGDGIPVLVNYGFDVLWPGGRKEISLKEIDFWDVAVRPEHGLAFVSYRSHEDRSLDVVLLDGSFEETRYQIPLDSYAYNLSILPVELPGKQEREYIFFTDGMSFICRVVDPKKGLVDSWKVKLPSGE